MERKLLNTQAICWTSNLLLTSLPGLERICRKVNFKMNLSCLTSVFPKIQISITWRLTIICRKVRGLTTLPNINLSAIRSKYPISLKSPTEKLTVYWSFSGILADYGNSCMFLWAFLFPVSEGLISKRISQISFTHGIIKRTEFLCQLCSA